MITWIEVTPEAAAAIRAAAAGDSFEDNSEKLENGNRAIPLSVQVASALRSLAFPGESWSDTILRLLQPRKH